MSVPKIYSDEPVAWQVSAAPVLYPEAASFMEARAAEIAAGGCLLYTSPSPRDKRQSRMPSSA